LAGRLAHPDFFFVAIVGVSSIQRADCGDISLASSVKALRREPRLAPTPFRRESNGGPMARSSSRTRTRRTARPRAVAAPVNPRTVFLASLGVAVLAGRQAERLASDVAEVPQRLRAGADAAVDTARSEVKKLAKSARSRIAPLKREADKLGAQIDAARVQGVAEAAKRLNPLLTRVGLPKIVAKAPAKRAAKAAVKRPVAKKAVKARRRA
jgi:hypothetical protein